MVDLACLFIVLFTTGLTKLLESHQFYDNIRNSSILGGETVASLASWTFLGQSYWLTLLLIRTRTRLMGLWGHGLMLLFGLYVALYFLPPWALFLWAQYHC
ncbi:MAG: hypothetical protein R2814_18220 [Flavobacteriaceae bacterium]